MSFICQSCDEPQGMRVKPVKKVLETRPKTYTKQIKVKGKWETIFLGRGTEIVKEARLCANCAE